MRKYDNFLQAMQLSSTLPDAEIKQMLEEVITEAIAEHEASMWKKFPEWVPGSGRYLCQIAGGDIKILTAHTTTNWSNVIAFRELPEPYKEGGENV